MNRPVSLPDWASDLAGLYWRLRATRPGGRPTRRTWYRRIADEKARLLGLGIDRFHLRRVCRSLNSSNARRHWL